MTCGIYLMRFSGTDKVYVGQSRNIEDRFIAHKYSFKIGTCSKKLQEAFLLYGLPEFSVLIDCKVEDLDACEVEAIQIFNSIDNGFNTSKGGGEFPSLPGELHPMSKYSNEQVICAFNLLIEEPFLTYKKIGEMTGIDPSSVSHICSGQNHKWLKTLFPDRYELLPNKGHDRSAKGLGKVYPRIVSPTGEEYEVTNTHAFAKEHSLDQGNLNKLLNYKVTSVKNWKRLPV